METKEYYCETSSKGVLLGGTTEREECYYEEIGRVLKLFKMKRRDIEPGACVGP